MKNKDEKDEESIYLTLPVSSLKSILSMDSYIYNSFLLDHYYFEN